MIDEVFMGDCRDMMREIPDGSVKMLLTDPPYGVDHESNFGKGEDTKVRLDGDGDLAEALALWADVLTLAAPKLAPEAEVYVFTSIKVYEAFKSLTEDILNTFGFEWKMTIIWEKGWPGLGDLAGNWPYSYEMIMYFKRGRHPLPERRSSVIAIDRVRSTEMIHPTEKPVALLEHLIRLSTNEGETVLDPFGGSASTFVACQKMGRHCWTAETNPVFQKRITERLAQPMLAF